MKNRTLILSLAALAVLHAAVYAQGDLTPPDAPGPTMKTLDQVQPRTPISSLPFAITTPGSYYLTDNLSGGADGGITISASGVTLDLMGFELVGGTGDGVTITGVRSNICVRNGVVRGWSEDGVDTSNASNSHLQHLQATDNALGLRVGNESVVRDCVAGSNVSGIATGARCQVRDCVVGSLGASGIGIQVAGTTVIIGNTCHGDGDSESTQTGIYATGGSNRVEANHVTACWRGISTADGGGGPDIVIRNSVNSVGGGYYVTLADFIGPLLTTATQVNSSSSPHANYQF